MEKKNRRMRSNTVFKWDTRYGKGKTEIIFECDTTSDYKCWDLSDLMKNSLKEIENNMFALDEV